VKMRQLMAVLIAALGAAILPMAAARADSVLYDSAGFLRGTESFAQTFNLPSAGTLTVTLSNVEWPVQLASLNVLVSSSNGMLGPSMGAGTSTFYIAAGGNITAQWFGTAQGPLDAGVYSMVIAFQPAVTAVPLPASIVLLLPALFLLPWQRRRALARARA
jgi:hypothetical protein